MVAAAQTYRENGVAEFQPVFMLVGLELKREVVEGQLSRPDQVILPVMAAIGGLVVPAAIFWWINGDFVSQKNGWAIPTATDIVLALGILSFLGRRVPASLKIFLTALAIFDDIGAVVIRADLVSIHAQLRQDPLGINQRLRAAEANKADRGYMVGHGPSRCEKQIIAAVFKHAILC